MWIRILWIHIISPPGSVSGDRIGPKELSCGPGSELFCWIRIIMIWIPKIKNFKIRLGMNFVNFPQNFGGFLVFADGVKSTDKLHLAETETG